MDKDNLTGLLLRFCVGETSQEENNRLAEWMQEDPENNQKLLNDIHSIHITSLLAGDISDEASLDLARRRTPRFAVVRKYAMTIAATLLVAAVCGYFFYGTRLKTWAGMRTEIEAPLGQRTRVVLQDGSVVDLNSGSRIVYPAVFAGKERRIELYGEARFDVAPDKDKPFVVETFAYDVRVLGTCFNVEADESKNIFATALFDGKVSIRNHQGLELMTLEPDTEVRLRNGTLLRSRFQNRDQYLWTEGIIFFQDESFLEITDKLQKCYNVTFEFQRPDYPRLSYGQLKIRVSDGIDHALRVLQLVSDFSYEYVNDQNKIIIK